MKKKMLPHNLVSQAYHNPRYEGKHIIVIGGKVYATKTGMAQVKLLEKLMKKYPMDKPSIAYIPDALAFNTIISSRNLSGEILK